MNYLEITFDKPRLYAGGGIVIVQSILSLSELGNVDYIGPEFDTSIISHDNFRVLKFLKHERSIIRRIPYAISGKFNGYYLEWCKIRDKIDWQKYDVIHLEYTKYPEIINDIHKHGKKVVVRMHNVEEEYFRKLLHSRKSIKHMLQYIHYSHREKQAFIKSDYIIALTSKDKFVVEKYKEKDRVSIIPICLEQKKKRPYNKNGYLLMTGSLWYGPNVDGIKWFIQNVWKEIGNKYNDLTLVIAGSNPEKELESIVSDYSNIRLIKNPPDMKDIFAEARAYLAPIFTGAGMKVKVAEALSYGVPIIATSHALIGYDNYDDVIMCADNKEMFINNIEKIIKLNDDDINMLIDKINGLFETGYSLSSSVNKYDDVISKVRML